MCRTGWFSRKDRDVEGPAVHLLPAVGAGEGRSRRVLRWTPLSRAVVVLSDWVGYGVVAGVGREVATARFDGGEIGRGDFEAFGDLGLGQSKRLASVFGLAADDLGVDLGYRGSRHELMRRWSSGSSRNSIHSLVLGSHLEVVKLTWGLSPSPPFVHVEPVADLAARVRSVADDARTGRLPTLDVRPVRRVRHATRCPPGVVRCGGGPRSRRRSAC